MTAPILAFFNNKGGVGTTLLVYHLAWMFADRGRRVVAADFDPQANLTAAFLNEPDLEQFWLADDGRRTVYGAVRPLEKGTGDVAVPHVERIDDRIGLLVGDLSLARLEDDLSTIWQQCLEGREHAFRVTSAFWRLLDAAARETSADLTLVDIGPSLGAINRAALVACDYVIIPMSTDLSSLHGLRNLGRTLRTRQEEWSARVRKKPDHSLELPGGAMRPLGYVMLQHGVRLDRPATADDRWMRRIPDLYEESVLGQEPGAPRDVSDDPNCLGVLKHYHSLISMAREARKPVFHLRAADGAIGAHQQAVARAYDDFARLADEIERRLGRAT
jgi:chromosome partitioning protein